LTQGYTERVADDGDPLRHWLRAAKAWRIPPTVFLRRRTVNCTEWTDDDTAYALALEDYEAQCDHAGHYLPETTKAEHEDAYRPDPEQRTRCHKCRAQALVDEVLGKEEGSDGVILPLVLDADVVALNLLPVPPLPPELLLALQSSATEATPTP
jgi:hypothetical protein